MRWQIPRARSSDGRLQIAHQLLERASAIPIVMFGSMEVQLAFASEFGLDLDVAAPHRDSGLQVMKLRHNRFLRVIPMWKKHS
ncbi:hypothetical protein Plhal304r1_c030g0097041 [Plasmopara halstedii]